MIFRDFKIKMDNFFNIDLFRNYFCFKIDSTFYASFMLINKNFKGNF